MFQWLRHLSAVLAGKKETRFPSPRVETWLVESLDKTLVICIDLNSKCTAVHTNTQTRTRVLFYSVQNNDLKMTSQTLWPPAEAKRPGTDGKTLNEGVAVGVYHHH